MADNSGIEWTDATWNPITGCSVVSPGCTNCYAMRLAGGRMQHHWSREGLTEPSKAGPVWNGQVRFNEPWLDQPLRWKRPRTIFVCAHGDLFHEAVPDEWIDRVFGVMALASQHRFQVLTKRAERMREYLSIKPAARLADSPEARIGRAALTLAQERGEDTSDPWWDAWWSWPLPNVWLGISAEDQRRAEERIPLLLDTPAAVRFVSAEPLLGPVDLSRWMWPTHWRWDGQYKTPEQALAAGAFAEKKRQALISREWADRLVTWVIAGGESGPGARPMHPDWPRAIRDQCQAAGVPFFFKQWGEWLPGDMDRSQSGPPHWRMPEAVWQDGQRGYRDAPVPRPGTFVAWAKDGSLHHDVVTYEEQQRFRDKHGSPAASAFRLGKKAAGRALDGRTWDGMPA